MTDIGVGKPIESPETPGEIAANWNAAEDDDNIVDDMEMRFDKCVHEVWGEPVLETAAGCPVLDAEPISVLTWERLCEAADKDAVLVKLMEVVLKGFPESNYDDDEETKEFNKFRHDMQVAERLVFYKDRIIIPAVLRPQVLETIHATHQGVTGMIDRVEDIVFWPGISADIIRTRGSCLTRVRDAPSQPAGTPVTPPTPPFPFQVPHVKTWYQKTASRQYKSSMSSLCSNT